jgi:hypothetical protein
MNQTKEAWKYSTPLLFCGKRLEEWIFQGLKPNLFSATYGMAKAMP